MQRRSHEAAKRAIQRAKLAQTLRALHPMACIILHRRDVQTRIILALKATEWPSFAGCFSPPRFSNAVMPTKLRFIALLP